MQLYLIRHGQSTNNARWETQDGVFSPRVSDPVLTAKGMAMGTALAFMMAVIGLSLPEMIILRKVIRIKLLAIFAGILFVAFTLTGYLFNAILG